MPWWLWGLIVVGALLVIVFVHDSVQKRHSILRTFPVVGHLRFLLEKAGPEMRQYIVADNDEERPFNRDRRRWVYATAKQQNSYFGFGTDNEIDAAGHITIRHSAFPLGREVPDDAPIPCGKVMGARRGRAKAFRPASVVNVSAMSYGSLSGPAIEALNRGSHMAGCLHNTGEGGVSAFHRNGGELVFQLGTGYFGCRHPDGTFSMERLVETVSSAPVRAIEIKLSQGAKPGVGGLLPAAKVSPQIAAARGIPVGRDVRSPSRHSAFANVGELVDFVEETAAATGLPVGIKSAVGQEAFWTELAQHMATTRLGPDFVTVDGAEGGTGAGPLVFTDHVALPFWRAFSVVHRAFGDAGLTDDIVLIGSAKLGFPAPAVLAFNVGVDMIGVAREPMLAIGCIQAQRCHTNHCPTGVTTQNKWLARGLDPSSKSVRLANYVIGLRRELLRLADACGVEHPGLIGADNVNVISPSGQLEAADRALGMRRAHTHSPARIAGLREAVRAEATVNASAAQRQKKGER
ncbi:glutamate synthase-related protein [Candidatus Poriferisodalis sp.]|uniref:glutamate synthase-related protein n=1 Tax=Candidatus Poriferisodalis sp. TaxID=3101277 RepID=UPI003B02E158